MSVNRSQVDLGGNNVQAQPVGARTLSQEQILSLTTADAGTLTAAMLLAGILERTGPGADYADTFPSADSLLLAQPELSVGDAFKFIHRNTVAFAMTATAGEGVVLGSNVDIASSLVREYLISILATGPRQIFQGTTVNASPIVTGIPLANAALLQVGQGVTGTGIPANAYIISINQSTGTLTLSANATASGTVALTTFARYRVNGVRSASL